MLMLKAISKKKFQILMLSQYRKEKKERLLKNLATIWSVKIKWMVEMHLVAQGS